MEDSDEILGGYNPIKWKSVKCWDNTKDSFIFSFKNNDKIENCILSRVKDAKNAVHNSPIRGPTFGTTDLSIWKPFGGSGSKKGSYEKPIRETENSFFVEECEVFQVVQD